MIIATLELVFACILVSTVSCVYAWHEDLGISDVRATGIYNNHTLSPENLKIKNSILEWKAGLQNQLDFIDLFCFGKNLAASSNVTQACLGTTKIVYDNCFHHPGIDEECYNPELEKYMIQNSISGTYDNNYTKIEPTNSSAPSIKEFRADVIYKMRELCIATGLDCNDLPSR